jgi:hypothetical protein
MKWIKKQQQQQETKKKLIRRMLSENIISLLIKSGWGGDALRVGEELSSGYIFNILCTFIMVMLYLCSSDFKMYCYIRK